MSDIVESFTQDNANELILQNLLGFYRIIYTDFPGVELFDEPDFFGYKSTDERLSLHNFNRIIHIQRSKEELIKVLAGFSGKPIAFWTPPTTKPSNIYDILPGLGFRLIIDCPAMACGLDGVDFSRMKVPGLDVKRVTNRELLDDYTNTYNQAYNRIPLVGQMHSGRFIKIMSDDSSWQRWVGYIGDEPVTVSDMYLDAGVAGVYSVFTKEEHRGKGIGLAMTLQPMKEAFDRGYKVSVLQATDMSERIYRRIGFRDVCRYGFWLRL
ncbi:MAG TPA: GNAT family N-acetyltransferase [Caldisericia bacterium]|nr:GNAT family N-acetyltransferase [Caldisericia bacterium]HPF49421.1 GNAT family N-acetyltransferase [Caldisericia bacterium]HPI84376.1 GNAT family N-acetyltransferase [Caldisericia bacterium]HPQ93592.1 GNAT family N-acetyltransferase [Caldisericia bacterium]HRV75561.1 GNAT family N-acetyltransferase [Caldisericia bacterium]